MARIRSLKPDFFRSRSLRRVSREARWTFAGLWCEADDYGNGVDDAHVLAGSIWPGDPDIGSDEVESHLVELERTGHVLRYEADDGERYYHVTNWEKHQNMGRRAAARYPAPPDDPGSQGTSSSSQGSSVPPQGGSAQEGNGGEGMGVEEEVEASASVIIDLACRILAERATKAKHREDPARYMFGALRGKLEDHTATAERLLSERRMSPEELADTLEPPPAQRRLAAVRPACALCNTTGWVEDDAGDAVRCQCRRAS